MGRPRQLPIRSSLRLSELEQRSKLKAQAMKKPKPSGAPSFKKVALPTMRNLKNPLMEHPKEYLSVGADKEKDKKGMSNMIYGPLCWKCYGVDTWWRCQGCRKAYHKSCVFLGEGYPHPIFNMALKKAVDAKERGASILVKCTQCILSKETMLPEFQQAPIETMHEAFTHIAHLVEKQFRTIMVEINNESVVASPKLIRNTLLSIPNCYKTVDAFSADYKLIRFQTIRRYGLLSEPTLAVTTMLEFVREELLLAILCWECYVRRYESHCWGKLLPEASLLRNLKTICTVPHPLIWVSQLPFFRTNTQHHSREGGQVRRLNNTFRVYWPAKLLFCDEDTKHVCFHLFDERGVRRMKLDEGVKFFYFSKENPNGTSRKRKKKRNKNPSQAQVKLQNAISACKKYLKNLRERFGAEEVIIPEKIADFDGESYESVFQKMFPYLDMDALHKARWNPPTEP